MAGTAVSQRLCRVCVDPHISFGPGRLTGRRTLPRLLVRRYDGQRAQIHLLPDRTVRIFSRNCDDNTAKFPDVIETVKQAARGGCSSFIIDAEVRRSLTDFSRYCVEGLE